MELPPTLLPVEAVADTAGVLVQRPVHLLLDSGGIEGMQAAAERELVPLPAALVEQLRGSDGVSVVALAQQHAALAVAAPHLAAALIPTGGAGA